MFNVISIVAAMELHLLLYLIANMYLNKKVNGTVKFVPTHSIISSSRKRCGNGNSEETTATSLSIYVLKVFLVFD